MSTPGRIELNQDKFVAFNDLVKVLHIENSDTLVLGDLCPQDNGGESKKNS